MTECRGAIPFELKEKKARFVWDGALGLVDSPVRRGKFQV
jgi:hypothetical protein